MYSKTKIPDSIKIKLKLNLSNNKPYNKYETGTAALTNESSKEKIRPCNLAGTTFCINVIVGI